MTHRKRVASAARGARTPGVGGYIPAQDDWQSGALCLEVGSFLFDEAFDDPDGTGSMVVGTTACQHAEKRRIVARTICQVCPMLDDCASQAFTNAEKYGIWAGLSQIQRARIATTRTTIAACVTETKTRLFAAGEHLGDGDLTIERAARVAYAREQADVLRAVEAQIIQTARNEGTIRSLTRGAQKDRVATQIAS